MKLLLICIGLFFYSELFSQAKTVDYNGAYTTHNLINAELSYLPAGDSAISLQQAMALYANGRFLANNGTIINHGISADDYWIHCAVKNNTLEEQQLYLQLDNPRLNGIDIYVVQNGKIILADQTGDLLPFNHREEKINKFTFPLTMGGMSEQDIFFLVKHKGSSLQLGVSLLSKGAFANNIQKEYLSIGFRMGFLFIVVCFGIFLFFNTKNKNFIFFSIYVFTAGLWIWSTEGFGFQFTWPQCPQLNNRLEASLGVFYSAVFILNTLQFTKPYDKQDNVLRIILRVFMYCFFAWGVLPLLPFTSVTVKGPAIAFLYIFFAMNISGVVIMAIYLIKLFLRGHSIILYYFLAVMITLILSVMVSLFNTGWINLPFSSGTLMSIGIITDVVLMTLGLTRQFYNYKQEKENMLVEYLEQQKSITQKILETQQEERTRISRELHDDIGAGLTQIILMSEAADKKETKVKELTEIAATGRQLVSNMGELIWSFNPENSSLEQFFIYMREQLNNLLEYANITYQIDLPDYCNGIELSAMQRRNTLLVTKELVHNAIKHSKAKHIQVKATINVNSILSFEIGDNGTGFNTENIYGGNGLKNIRQRIKDINGTFLAQSVDGKGTVFYYTIPLKQ